MNLKNKSLSKINITGKYVWSDYIYIQFKKLRENLIYWLGMCIYRYIYICICITRRKITTTEVKIEITSREDEEGCY